MRRPAIGWPRRAAVDSSPVRPVITSSVNAASADVALIGPTWSIVGDMPRVPLVDTRPKVAFNPTTPQYDAGPLTEPPVCGRGGGGRGQGASETAQPEDEPPVI